MIAIAEGGAIIEFDDNFVSIRLEKAVGRRKQDSVGNANRAGMAQLDVGGIKMVRIDNRSSVDQMSQGSPPLSRSAVGKIPSHSPL